MTSIKHKIIKSISKFIPKGEKLIILDNFFPNLNCGFKINEYNYLLERFPNSEVHSTMLDFDLALPKYLEIYPQFKGRIKKFDSKRLFFASLFYISFLDNTYSFLPIIERENTPFIFTLYGGGFFGIDYPESDKKLAQICQSPLLKKIIVSQTITAEYLVKKNFCSKEKITLIYGSTPSTNQTEKRYLEINKQYYTKEKETFDICFVGRKHIPRGEDKGYPIFIEVAKRLSKKYKNIFFHVVGNFGPHDIDVKEIKQRIKFYGEIPIQTLPKFFETQDILLAMNVPGKIHKGSFEGINGVCQEAAYAKTMVFATDPWKLNYKFKHEQDIIIIPDDSEKIAKKIIYYYNNPQKLYQLSEASQKAFLKVFDFKRHVSKKAQVLEEYI